MFCTLTKLISVFERYLMFISMMFGTCSIKTNVSPAMAGDISPFMVTIDEAATKMQVVVSICSLMDSHFSETPLIKIQALL